MTLRDKVAQLVIVTSFGEAPSSRSAAYRDFVRSVRDLKVGGMIVVNRVVGGSVRNAEPYAMATFLNRMQRLATVPLMVGGDFERGASMRVSGTPKYPPPRWLTAQRAISTSHADSDLATGPRSSSARSALGLRAGRRCQQQPGEPIINIGPSVRTRPMSQRKSARSSKARIPIPPIAC
jgi:beta-N-acetylhexosaminidase